MRVIFDRQRLSQRGRVDEGYFLSPEIVATTRPYPQFPILPILPILPFPIPYSPSNTICHATKIKCLNPDSRYNTITETLYRTQTIHIPQHIW